MADELSAEMVARFVPPRAAASRKGQNGRVLIVGGGTIYHGAPVLASLAALRAGADLVYTAVPKHHAAPVRAYSPNLIVIPMADQKLTKGAARKIAGAAPVGLDAAAVGMGLAVAEDGALDLLVSSLLRADVRVLLDAGALRASVLPAVSGSGCLLTPHAGEFARIFGEAPPDALDARVRAVERRASEYGVTILLKGPTDVISDGSATYTCSKSAPAMTVGGTGDVLSGVAASLMSRSRSIVECAAAAAFVNSRAGLAAQERLGLHIAATDVIGGLPAALRPFDRIE